MTANPYRGEVSIVLGGETFAARPSYTAILKWEEATGRTTTELLVRMTSGVWSLRELAAIFHASLEAGGTKLRLEDLGERIVQEGQTDMLRPAATLLKNALTGGKSDDEPGEAMAVLGPGGSSTAA